MIWNQATNFNYNTSVKRDLENIIKFCINEL